MQPNPAYQFSFDVKDDEFTNYQNRKEQREGDKISGSYSVVDSDGYIRTVTYTADPKEVIHLIECCNIQRYNITTPEHEMLMVDGDE